MDAPLRQWQASDDWKRGIDLDRILSERGIDVSSSEIVVSTNGTLEYAGRNVAVYIRDQEQRVYTQSQSQSQSQSSYRFHVANCKTLKNMRVQGKYEKYVVATRDDGVFLVNKMSSGRVVNNTETRLKVCRNCLSSLRWQNYKYGMDHIWQNFNLREFFATYGSTIIQTPRYTDQNSPTNEYPENWNKIAKNYKENIKWICEKCNIDLSDKSANRFLHVHHIDNRKENTQIRNLLALCLECHSKQGGHQHMTAHPDYNDFQAYKFLKKMSN